jgi:hypothetical protein
MPLRIDAPPPPTRKREKLFSGNKNPHFWDIKRRGCTPLKREKLFSGNKKPRFWDIRQQGCTPRKRKKLFSGNKNPHFWDIQQNNPRQMAPFLPNLQTWSHFCKFGFCNGRIIYALMFMRRKKFRKLPSAARFFTKRF